MCQIVKWDQYKVEVSPKGRGTYGEVYFGLDLKNRRKVCIKKVPNVTIAKKEVSIMKTYGKSKHLPVFYKYFEKNNQAHIVMEAIKGETLGTSNFYYAGKKRTQKQAVRIVIRILSALQHLHHKGIVHNDLLPKNVMIHDDTPSTVKLIDFNLSKHTKSITSRQIDLYKAALMCVFLMNGKVPQRVFTFAMKNVQLKNVLLKGMKSGYNSAQDFMGALRPFS
ncbi:protein kinase family protein [Alteribacillus sp. YIM 98480]|uniref:protein kinase family protein n=1 Tax=Alteribacillus sp. YIM 98480 TaxID=2606599 RepID=UPI00131E889E|nr:protein kinase family protein [Alteribacillus sp. YIM 98480]